MICRNIKHILTPNTSDKTYLISSRQYSRQWLNIVFRKNTKTTTNMSSPLKLRHIFRDFVLPRLFGVWTRSCFVGSVVRRCRKDGRFREVIQCFRHAVLRPRRTLLLTVTAAYKNNEEKPGPPGPCAKNITDQELADLLTDLAAMDELCRATLYCPGCDRRVAIDSARPNVRYCQCDKTKSPESTYDGWEPFLEAEEIIIWRKEYKPGPLYAYKVYGRYKTLNADDFAAIQVDGRYRKVWDTAVASLTVVEHEANGKIDQDVVHWEVLWPRFFANRDYVYLRRHKAFDVPSQPYQHKDRVFDPEPPSRDVSSEIHDRPTNVHWNAKRKALEDDAKEQLLKPENLDNNKNLSKKQCRKKPPCNKEKTEKPPKSEEIPKIDQQSEVIPEPEKLPEKTPKPEKLPNKKPPKADKPTDKVYVIVSRSCTHDEVPNSSNAIRVTEYWSHMVVKTINGSDKPGMEFVLTYYDEPAVGGLPNAVTAWAMGRAGPAFLQRMRAAAIDYRDWRIRNPADDSKPDFTPFDLKPKDPDVRPVSLDVDTLGTNHYVVPTSELEMESSREGPLMGEDSSRRDQATQTSGKVVLVEIPGTERPADQMDNNTETTLPEKQPSEILQVSNKIEGNGDTSSEGESEREDQNGWWRYLYPFYYFS